MTMRCGGGVRPKKEPKDDRGVAWGSTGGGAQIAVGGAQIAVGWGSGQQWGQQTHESKLMGEEPHGSFL